MLGGDAALRGLIDASHATGHPGRARRRLQPRQPRVLPVPRHPGERGSNSAYLDWFFFDREALAAGAPCGPIRWRTSRSTWRRSATSSFPATTRSPVGYRAWWNLPALPKFNTDTPAVREYLWGIGRAVDRLRHRRLAARRAHEIDDEGFWQEFRRGSGGEPRRLHRRRGLDRAAAWLRGDMWDAVMNYLFTRACIAFFIGGTVDRRRAQRGRSAPRCSTTGPAFAGRSRR